MCLPEPLRCSHWPSDAVWAADVSRPDPHEKDAAA